MSSLLPTGSEEEEEDDEEEERLMTGAHIGMFAQFCVRILLPVLLCLRPLKEMAEKSEELLSDDCARSVSKRRLA
jgi:hypothetical protein